MFLGVYVMLFSLTVSIIGVAGDFEVFWFFQIFNFYGRL